MNPCPFFHSSCSEPAHACTCAASQSSSCFPWEGSIITLIICITIVVVALIVRKLILKAHTPVIQHVDDADQRQNQERLKRRNALIDRRLSFAEKLAMEGFEENNKENNKKINKEYADKYLELLKEYIDEKPQEKK